MDYILRATAGDGSVRIFIANTKETVNEAFLHHKTSPVMSAALGRALTAVSIMGCMLKSDSDLITIKINGDGEGKGVVVTSNNKSEVKGYALNPIVDIPLREDKKLDVKRAIGNGTLTVIKDMGLKEPYFGQIPLISSEIAEDLTYYFAKSEQTPSAVSLGVLVDKDYTIKQSGGFIIQLMPNAKEEVISLLEDRISTLKPFTTLLEEGKTPEDILNILFEGLEPKILDKLPVKFYCNCSRERVEKALISIGKDEIKAILKEDKKASIHCHFCNKDYDFTEEDLQNILNNFK